MLVVNNNDFEVYRISCLRDFLKNKVDRLLLFGSRISFFKKIIDSFFLK